MRMSCNGCRVLRKGCNDSCILRPCLEWIKSAQSQANATIFLAKFYGRTGLINLISNGPQHSRPALFRSLLYEACGRLLNPIYGSVGLLWSGNWAACQAGVESILQGIYPVAMANNVNLPHGQNEAQHTVLHGALMQSIASELHKVEDRGKFKPLNPRRKPKSKQHREFLNNLQISSGEAEGGGIDIRKKLHNIVDNAIFSDNDVFSSAKDRCSSEYVASQQPDDLAGVMNCNTFDTLNPKVEASYLQNSEAQAELGLELTLGAREGSSEKLKGEFTDQNCFSEFSGQKILLFS